MSAHQSYLDRMTTRLHDLEHEIAALAEKVDREGDDVQQRGLRELQASLAAAKERLQSLRMAAAEVSDEMTQSFTQSFSRVQAALGRARAAV
jgi:predicted  nucleic acid-binding Zn-ribbon protein